MALALAALGCGSPSSTASAPPAPPASVERAHAAWGPDCAVFDAVAPVPGETIVPSEDKIRATLRAMFVPSAPHRGVAGSSDEERAAWRARFRTAYRDFAIYARGAPSGIERALEVQPSGALVSLLPFLALDEFPEVLRGGDRLDEPELAAEYRGAIARAYCRELTRDDASVRLRALRRSSHDAELRHDPLERYGLGPVLARLLEAPDRATRLAALDRLCAFDVPPGDARTVAALEALVREPTPPSLDELSPGPCVTWLFARIASEQTVSLLIDHVFAAPHTIIEARCALESVIEPRHHDAVRASYRRAAPGISFAHIGPAVYASPLLSELGLTDVVRDDLRSTDGDLVYRGIRFAARLAPGDAVSLLEELTLRTDLPDPPTGERRDWYNHVGLANEARDALAYARRRVGEPQASDRCRGWACRVTTYGLTNWPGCAELPQL